MPGLASSPITGGRRRSGASVKTLKRVLKKAGLKTSGRKAALTRRAKKAHLTMKGGEDDKMKMPMPMPTETVEEVEVKEEPKGGRKRRSRGYAPLY